MFEPRFEEHPYKQEILDRLIRGDGITDVFKWLNELAEKEHNPNLTISKITLRVKRDKALGKAKPNVKKNIAQIVRDSADEKVKQLWKTIRDADKLIENALKSGNIKKLKIESIKDFQSIAQIKRDALDLINKLEGNSGNDSDVTAVITELTNKLLADDGNKAETKDLTPIQKDTVET